MIYRLIYVLFTLCISLLALYTLFKGNDNFNPLLPILVKLHFTDPQHVLRSRTKYCVLSLAAAMLEPIHLGGAHLWSEHLVKIKVQESDSCETDKCIVKIQDTYM